MATATTEPVWLIEATCSPDAAESRVPFRAEHLARFVRLIEEGVVVEVGAMADVSASVVMIRAGSEAAALEICRQDVYTKNGIWVEFRVRSFNRVVVTNELNDA
jgi:uncharacterized protein YciI